MFDLAPNRLFIQDVAPRDGLQNEPDFIPTGQKIALVDALSRSGLHKIEVTSFVSPKAIPALADAEQVLAGIHREPGVLYSALVPNERGCERALACQLDELNLVMSASEGHSLANLRRLPADSIQDFSRIVRLADGKVALNVSLSTTFGCPFDGEVTPDTVHTLIQQLVDIGIPAVTLCDTTGMANPAQVHQLCAGVAQRFPQLALTAHFHDTRGMGLANVLAALQAGIRHFDASLAGLGGCPYAPGASGNICTEDMVHMLDEMGHDTGVDLERLLQAATLLTGLIPRPLPSKLLLAGPASRRYPLPKAAEQLRQRIG